jgi:hypothetical protein
MRLLKSFIKVFTIIFLLVLITNNVKAQDSIAPADTAIAEKVKEAFEKQYPKMSLDEWVNEDGVYKITFYDDNKWYDVKYTDKGKWLETSILIDYERLPKEVAKAFEKSKYKDRDVYIVTEVSKPETDVIYRLLIDDIKEDEIEIEFDSSGKLTKEP